MKILLLDIETAPIKVYAWGLFDQNINIDWIEKPGYTLCWAAKWLGEKEMMFSSVYKDGGKKMLKKVHELITEADVVIHYNGTRFDIPTLNAEFVKQNLKPPAPYKQVDLYRTAKRQFKLPSNKMDYVARHLGVKGKFAHKGIELWRGCMEGDEECWEEMEVYNKQDIDVLEAVYEKLQPWVPNHPNHNLYDESDGPVCTNCGSKHLIKRGTSKTSTMIYQRYQCKVCGTWSRGRTNIVEKERRSNVIVQDRG